MKTTRAQYVRANRLHSTFRELIIAMMKRDGRNFAQCELCHAKIPKGKFQLHHTKYEGATYYDLRIVCGKCNLSKENCFLV